MRLHRIIGSLLLTASLVAGWFVWDYQLFVKTPIQIPPSSDIYRVAPGATITQIADELEALGVIRSATYFVWLARISERAHKIRYGEYQLRSGMSADSLQELFTKGRTVQYALTLVEGWNITQLLAAISAETKLRQTLDGVDHAALLSMLGVEEEHPEGLFLPDTYHFPRGMSDVQFLRRAYDAMQAYLTAAWEKRAKNLPYANAYEALIMASIVEKETGKAEERPAIAGVFVRRLQRGMRLQTDPTVIYGLGDRYDGDIKRTHLREATPYNTYVINGLPPTPIAMPGRAAIDAALHPADGDALYFVATGDGGHTFSATLVEHNAAVQRFLNRQRR
jgi:UPF0755 protein